MIRIIKCENPGDILSLYSRRESSQNVDETVAAIIADVKKRGDKAVLEYTKRFDGEVKRLEVPREEIDSAFDAAEPEFMDILVEAKANITAFHEHQKRDGFVMTEKPGIVLGQRITPLERAGIYVPGGTASYPSTVLMNAIPAKIAGVSEIIMATPPGSDGKVSADILAAARLAGVDRVFAMGGAQAVAAMAYGTESVPAVDKITGPGNIYVATAKRMVYGACGIDMIAGPSEILIIADENANPAHVAMDMLSQAEHDPLAAAVLVTCSEELAKAVSLKIEEFLTDLPRRETARVSIESESAIIVVSSIEKAARISDIIAPEHLELCVDDPFALLGLIRNAGSIFMGRYAPESLGDYFAGPNHTLPTSGSARFSSPLSVDDFTKKSSFIYYDENALRGSYKKISAFARREGLEAHAHSASIRLDGNEV